MFKSFLVLSIILGFASNVFSQVRWNTPSIADAEKGIKIDVTGTISSIKLVQVTWLSNAQQPMAEGRREIKLKEFPGNNYHLMDDTVIKADRPIEIGTRVDIISSQETTYHDLVKGNAKYFSVLSIKVSENKQSSAKTPKELKTSLQSTPSYTPPAEGKTSPPEEVPLVDRAWYARAQRSNLGLSKVGQDTLITLLLESPANPRIIPRSTAGKSQLLLEIPQGKTGRLPARIEGDGRLVREILTEPVHPGGGVRIILNLLPNTHFTYWKISRPVLSGKTIFVLGLKPEAHPLADQASGPRKGDIGTNLSQKGESKNEVKSAGPSADQPLAAVRQNHKCGFIDQQGKIVIPLQFEEAVGFTNDGLAAVKKGGKYGWIDRQGKIVIPLQYEETGGFGKDGLAYIKQGGKYGFINKHGNILILPQFTDISFGGFYDGLAAVKGASTGDFTGQEWKLTVRSLKWGFINTQGKVVIPPQYENPINPAFREGLAAVKKDGKFGFIDKSGTMTIPAQFEEGSSFSDGLASVKKNGRYGFIDKHGKMVISPQFKFAGHFSEGLAPVQQPGSSKVGFIDNQGKMIISPQFDSSGYFNEGLAYIQRGSKYGFIDKQGKMVISPQFDYDWRSSRFSKGKAAVKQGGKWGFIDKSGRMIIPAQFEGAWDFR